MSQIIVFAIFDNLFCREFKYKNILLNKEKQKYGLSLSLVVLRQLNILNFNSEMKFYPFSFNMSLVKAHTSKLISPPSKSSEYFFYAIATFMVKLCFPTIVVLRKEFD